jgi:hypothetical protein
MPSSRKGKGVKRITRKPVPITADLAAKLTRAVGKRAPTEPLLLRADGKAWRPENQDYWLPFRNTVTRAGLDPKIVTLYALRHSSIVRALLAGVPTRVVAVQHDTSVAMLERTYSAFIADHSDAVGRRGLLNPRSRSPTTSSLCPTGGAHEQAVQEVSRREGFDRRGGRQAPALHAACDPKSHRAGSGPGNCPALVLGHVRVWFRPGERVESLPEEPFPGLSRRLHNPRRVLRLETEVRKNLA